MAYRQRSSRRHNSGIQYYMFHFHCSPGHNDQEFEEGRQRRLAGRDALSVRKSGESKECQSEQIVASNQPNLCRIIG